MPLLLSRHYLRRRGDGSYVTPDLRAHILKKLAVSRNSFVGSAARVFAFSTPRQPRQPQARRHETVRCLSVRAHRRRRPTLSQRCGAHCRRSRSKVLFHAPAIFRLSRTPLTAVLNRPIHIYPLCGPGSAYKRQLRYCCHNCERRRQPPGEGGQHRAKRRSEHLRLTLAAQLTQSSHRLTKRCAGVHVRFEEGGPLGARAASTTTLAGRAFGMGS